MASTVQSSLIRHDPDTNNKQQQQQQELQPHKERARSQRYTPCNRKCLCCGLVAPLVWTWITYKEFVFFIKTREWSECRAEVSYRQMLMCLASSRSRSWMRLSKSFRLSRQLNGASKSRKSSTYRAVPPPGGHSSFFGSSSSSSSLSRMTATVMLCQTDLADTSAAS